MPDIEIEIGGRTFLVGCQEGEEHFLRTAAQMLDTEAQALLVQTGRIPEARMLLMAGLMLADKTAGAEDQLRESQARVAELEAQLAQAQARPAPAPERVEVAVIPQVVNDTLAEIAARAEALAGAVEEKAAR
ncbi:cell division protein ZapA [Defluviimonas sp. 20V17]|uniref:Cell division protein ZapA n=1 Tax=Allgaiera indica TaxID=765699 RepID=A0AAN5A013_9RHOB|nr:cell division protein ZapA [Allgaiera indica]KDB01885.1 cell division protein ZapA [Defluviimonas sp. 20V17]GHE02406.1 cell division protein ZapA [Allgaiera indica]SDX30331.1 cell division protein ZapA [Allgaiera indica]